MQEYDKSTLCLIIKNYGQILKGKRAEDLFIHFFLYAMP